MSKLPRRFSYFDYSLPENNALSSGDLVRITLKGRSLLGIIRGLKKTSEAPAVRQIDSLVTARFITRKDIERYERIAEVLGQSVSNLLSATFAESYDSLPPQYISPTQVPNFPTALLPFVSAHLQRVTKGSSLAIAEGIEVSYGLLQALRRRMSKQMLVLVPRERDVELVARRIQFGDKAAMLTGQTNKRERARIIEAWRRGELRTLVGTRQAALLPASELEVAVVLEAGNEEHLNERRNPRFDAREALKLLVAQHRATVLWLDPLPRLEEVVEGFEYTPTGDEQLKVISLQAKEERTAEPLLTETVIEEIKKALQSQKRVLLYLNRKGVAKRLQCAACGHIPLCGTCGQVPTVRQNDLVCAHCQTEMWIPEKCPSCGKPKIALRGVGGAKVEESLKKLFPQISLGHVEKGEVQNSQAQVILATEYFFTSLAEPFMPRDFGLVVDLMTDIGLHASDFRAPEITMRKMQRLRHFARYQGAQIIFQTWLPDVITGMLELKQWVAHELALRKQYQLPPYRTRYVVDGQEIERLDLATLTDRSKVIIDGPYVKSHESTS